MSDKDIKKFKDNECYEIGLSESDSYNIYYFPKLDKFYIWEEGNDKSVKLVSYNSIFEYNKDWFKDKAFIDADKDLGLNKLKGRK